MSDSRKTKLELLKELEALREKCAALEKRKTEPRGAAKAPAKGKKSSSALLDAVTAGKHVEERLRVLSQAVEQSPATIIITARDGAIEYVNQKFTELTGYEVEEVLGKNPRILKSGEHPPRFYEEMWDTILSGKEWRGEVCNKKKDGEIYWDQTSISRVVDENGETSHFIAVKEDITERKRLDERIRHMALHDNLTGLPNRRLFRDRLNQGIAWARRNNKTFALLYIDLDGFKPVNDTLGHEAGDEVLKKVAERLRACMRESDTASRVGGDEFVVILQDIGEGRDAEMVAQKIITRFSEPFVVSDHKVVVGASIGISVYPADGAENDVLVKKADAAMYKAKKSGGNMFMHYLS